ncbi:MAG TPA: thermonuclease family protein, partial [Acidimicrobiales bacterium]
EARDKYGRLLLYLWRARDHLFVNRSLAIDGYARILSIDPNVAHKADLGAASLAADRADRGLWGHCAPEPQR